MSEREEGEEEGRRGSGKRRISVSVSLCLCLSLSLSLSLSLFPSLSACRGGRGRMEGVADYYVGRRMGLIS